MNRLVTLILFFSFFEVSYSQNIPENLVLRRSFIDSMDSQTREHVIIDTLTNYYSQFDYDQLNETQKDLVLIKNICDSLYDIDLLENNHDLILVRAKNAFERIKYDPALKAIQDFKLSHDQLKPFIDNGGLADKIDEASPYYEERILDIIDEAFFSLEEWICMLPRSKVLSIYYYIVENKKSLYNDVDFNSDDNRIDQELQEEKDRISKLIIGEWEINKIYDIAFNDAKQIPENILKDQLFSDSNHQITFFATNNFKLNNGREGKYLLGFSSTDGERCIEILIDDLNYSLESTKEDELTLKKFIYFNHQYTYVFKKIK